MTCYVLLCYHGYQHMVTGSKQTNQSMKSMFAEVIK